MWNQSKELSRLEELEENEKEDRLIVALNFSLLFTVVLVICIMKQGYGLKILNFFSKIFPNEKTKTTSVRLQDMELEQIENEDGANTSYPPQLLNPSFMEGESLDVLGRS